ncbi:MAG: PQQ-binding-like beta-propeller repeat protein [Planctomycetota bacterium]
MLTSRVLSSGLLSIVLSLFVCFHTAEGTTRTEEFLRGYSDSELAAAKIEVPQRPDPNIGEAIPRLVQVSGTVFLDENENGERDATEHGLSQVSVTDGLNVVNSSSDGTFSFTLEMTNERHSRFVVATRPTGYRPTNTYFIRIPFDSEKETYKAEFGFVEDPLSKRKEFWFISTSDSQFQTTEEMLAIEKDFAQMTDTSGSPAFMTNIGDLTVMGTHYQFDMYDRIRKASKIRVYDIFGGHDGNCLKPRSTINYELRVGPPYYSWNYGGVHFVQFVTEMHFVGPEFQKRQEAWIQADLKSIPKDMPVIIATHYFMPAEWFDKCKEEGINIICQLFGHWHFVGRGSRGDVPLLLSAPARGRDWGAYTRPYSWVHVGPEGVRSELRIAGQHERLKVFAPGPKTVSGVQPLMILAYDSAKKVKKLTCQITSQTDQKQFPRLVDEGDWSWFGTFDANEVGEYKFELEAVDSTGQVWKRQQVVQVLNRQLAKPQLSRSQLNKSEASFSKGPGENLHPLWIKHTGSTRTVYADPVVVNGYVYVVVTDPTVGNYRSGVLCLDAKTGVKIWYTPSPKGDIRAGATVYKDTVYIVTGESWAAAMNAYSGKLIWSKPLKPEYRLGRPLGLNTASPVPTKYGLLAYNFYESLLLLDYKTGEQIAEFDKNMCYIGETVPTVDNDIMYFASHSGRFAIKLPSGDVLWQSSASAKSTSAGILYNGKFIYSFQDGARALDMKTGELLWGTIVMNEGSAPPTPTVFNDMILVNGTDLAALDSKTGEILWKVPCGREADRFERSRRQVLGGFSTPVVSGDLAYFGHDDTSIRAIDKTGDVKWEYRIGTPVKTDLAIDGNLLFVYDFAGNLWCFAPAKDY